MQNYDSLKTKTTQSILPLPESAKQHLRRRSLQCYQYKHCTDSYLAQIEPCTSGWTRNTDGEVLPLWFNGRQFPDELMKTTKRDAKMTQNPICNQETPPPRPAATPQKSHPQRFSAFVAKCTLQDGIELDDD